MLQDLNFCPFRSTLRLGILVFFGLLLPAGILSAETVEGIPVPRGYERIVFPADSFSTWLQKLPLKSGTEIRTHAGALVSSRRYNRFAVADMPLLFGDDLEQCADFCMRFWGEYHQAAGTLEKLYLFNYGGERQYFAGSGLSFKQFLRRAFAYSNSHSLKTGCLPVSMNGRAAAGGEPELRPGDMFVQNNTGGIGHVSMVVDACENRSGRRLYLIGFSFMPAQEFHIEKAPDVGEFGKRGWFSFRGYIEYLEKYYPYGDPVIRRFDGAR